MKNTRALRIGIDVASCGIGEESNKTGVYQVTKAFLLSLAKEKTPHTYLLYSFSPLPSQIQGALSSSMHSIVVKPIRLWHTLFLPLRLYRDRLDVYIGMAQALPFRLFPKKYKRIVLIHDIAFLLFPTLYDSSQQKRLTRQTKSAVSRADAILSVSHATKQDLEQVYQIAQSKLTVSLLGTSEERQPKTKKKKKVPYFLFVGTQKKTKNVPRILQAFALMKQKVTTDFQLVVAGAKGDDEEQIKNVYRKLPKRVQEDIQFLGFVSDEQRRDLYSNATCFVSPSLYEGFCLPALEALSYGCCVIGSTQAAMPEVIGKAGICVDPLDTNAIAQAMLCMLDPHQRNQYTKQTFQQTKKFSWDTFTRTIVHKAEEVAA